MAKAAKFKWTKLTKYLTLLYYCTVLDWSKIEFACCKPTSSSPKPHFLIQAPHFEVCGSRVG